MFFSTVLLLSVVEADEETEADVVIVVFPPSPNLVPLLLICCKIFLHNETKAS